MADEKQLSKKELVELLSQPLDPELQYFDATRALEAIADHVRDLHKLINYLFQAQGIQAAAIIELRKMQGAHAGAIEFLAGLAGAEPDEGPILAVTKPALVGPNGRKLS